MKARHSLRNFVALNSNCFKPTCRGKKKHILKMTLPQKNSARLKTPYPYLMNLVSNYLEKNILSDTVKINGIQSSYRPPTRLFLIAISGQKYSPVKTI